MGTVTEMKNVVVVGGGFAGIGAAKHLVKDPRVKLTLIDQNNYHQFQPLLYQVATSQLAQTDIAYPIRNTARKHPNFDVKLGRVTSIDPAARRVTTEEGQSYEADYLVLGAGSQPYFFKTPGAEEHAFPLYSVDDAVKLRARILQLFEEADRDPTLVDEGAVEFVVVGGGPTGVEISRCPRRDDPRDARLRIPRPRGREGGRPPRGPCQWPARDVRQRRR